MRKKSMFFYISLVCLILLMFVILLNDKTIGAQSNNLHKYNEEIDRILTCRLEIINNALFEDMNLDQLEKRLIEIESEDALDWDVNYLEEIKNNPTDFSYVSDFEIVEIKLLETNNNKYTFKAEIKWTIDNVNTETYEHSIEIINNDGKLLMTKFN